MRKDGKTIFLSSHLLSEVELVCDRIAVLDRGRLVRLGRTSELLECGEQTEIVARGIAAHAFSGAVVSDGLVTFSIPASAQRVTLQRVWELGGEVVSVNPLRRSLEELFVEVTKGTSANPQPELRP
ncbi:MAG: hypothetical protein DMG73_11980 [Acidobacteria bacterium]|nr:MAG: hypothetical protein DMG73_11980 [Acidobacteriota bacterium]